jgi:ABC-type uncharacterized transport system substrate-binding protein
MTIVGKQRRLIVEIDLVLGFFRVFKIQRVDLEQRKIAFTLFRAAYMALDGIAGAKPETADLRRRELPVPLNSSRVNPICHPWRARGAPPRVEPPVSYGDSARGRPRSRLAGGNITGSAVNAGFEIWGKRFGLLKEVLPMLSNACIIVHRRIEWEGPYGSAIRQAAKDASVALKETVFDGKIDEVEYQRVFSAFEQDRPDALIVSEFSVHFTNRATIVELAAKHRLPAMYAYRDFVEIGGLIAYSPDFSEVGRSVGHQMGQILNGTNPGDIPYNQVTHYELALNLKTAKSLDLEFPATLLGSADFIVE